MRLLLAATLAVSLALPTAAQHDHARLGPEADGVGVSEAFVVTGLRLDETDPPPGSAVGRAGLRFADGGYMSVVYGKPYVRGRVVFGGLVALDQVWSAGAHRATEMVTTVPLEIGGTRVAPGAYSLFVTPRRDGWTLHVNATLGMHLADEYDAARDLATVTVATSETAAAVEGLTWAFADDGAALTLAWDRTVAAFPIRRLT